MIAHDKWASWPCPIYKTIVMRIFLFFMIALSVSFVSCSEDDASDVIVLVNQSKFPHEAMAGDLVELEVHAFTERLALSSFSAYTYDTERGMVFLCDTVPGVNDFVYRLQYLVPTFGKDSMELTFNFEAVDELGHSQRTVARMTVAGGSVALEERSGLMIYSANSGKDNAFSLSDPSRTFISTLVDSSLVDIYAYCEDYDDEMISGEWRSMTGVNFVKNNAFDYVNATSVTVNDVFRGSRKSVRVNDVSRGDIIIVGRDAEALAVFHVIMVYDEAGTANDGYLLNYKMANN